MAHAGQDTAAKRRRSDRRGGDRRVSQLPFEGAERRAGQRRSGVDRRNESRTRLTP